MKKVCIIFLLSIIISLTAIGGIGGFGENSGFFINDSTRYASNETGSDLITTGTGQTDGYLRMHIRADSNDGAAQAVKYYVRDQIVAYLTPFVAEYATQEEATRGVADRLTEIAQVATNALRQKGFSYGATARLTRESFPTRVYDGYTLPAGEYTALIVELGGGEGDNWWCVVYPPLCFVAPSGQNVVYKSKIKEIVEEWKKRINEK